MDGLLSQFVEVEPRIVQFTTQLRLRHRAPSKRYHRDFATGVAAWAYQVSIDLLYSGTSVERQRYSLSRRPPMSCGNPFR